MARKPRVDRPGAWHHVMHRGVRWAPIFRANQHCLLFLGALSETVERFGVQVHAYSLMPNHYHLLLRSSQAAANLSRAMRHLNATYTQRLNRLHTWDGPVFRGRFRSQLLTRKSQLAHVLAYIHLNPVRAGLVSRPEAECWTSHRGYMGLERPPPWLTCGVLSTSLGGRKGVKDLVDRLRRHRASWPELLDLDSGWFTVGDEEVQERTGPAGATSAVRGRQEGVPEIRERTLKHVREVTGADRAELMRLEYGPRANPARRFAAWALDSTGRITQREIAATLRMRPGQVARLLARLRLRFPEPLGRWRKAFHDLPDAQS